MAEYFGLLALLVLLMPLFYAVEHSMRIWGSKSGQRLPVGQLIAVGLTGVVLQALWPLIILFSPWLFLMFSCFRIMTDAACRNAARETVARGVRRILSADWTQFRALYNF